MKHAAKVLSQVAGVVGAGSIILAAGYTGGSFIFAHFAQAQETDTRSRENKAVVEQLTQIQLERAAQEEAARQAEAARREVVLKMCISHTLTDPMQCAEVGYEVKK